MDSQASYPDGTRLGRDRNPGAAPRKVQMWGFRASSGESNTPGFESQLCYLLIRFLTFIKVLISLGFPFPQGKGG